MFNKKNKNEPTEATKLSRSGNPAKRSQAEKAERTALSRKRKKEFFVKAVGLTIVGVLAATLLVSAFGTSF